MTMCSAESTPDPNNGGTITKTPDTTNRNPNRRSNKPIMEKRRRARINNCLNELKGILLEAMRKDPARHSKLEKADILELTVSHLKALHRHHSTGGSGDGGNTRFRAGFAECAAEVGRFLASPKSDGIDPHTSGRLLAHLADCINSNPVMGSNPGVNPGSISPALGGTTNNSHPHGHHHHHHHHHPTHTPLSSLDPSSNNGNVSTTTLNVPPNTPIISLVPSRLSSGEIAFVVPGFNSSPNSHHTLNGGGGGGTNNGSGSPNLHHRGATVSSSAISLSAMQSLHCNPPPMLSPEVPLELTVSSSSSSGCSLSPNYPPVSSHHHHNHHHQTHHPHHPPYPSTKMESYSPSLPPANTQPLALVTPKKEEQDGNCWRPWW